MTGCSAATAGMDRESLTTTGGVELRHLRSLVMLAEELHFGHAALRLNVSQSTLSRTLADLECLVGERLVERTQRTIGLTSAGRSLASSAEATLRAVACGLHRARGADDRPLSLGLVNSLGYAWLPALRRELRARGHELPLEIRPLQLADGIDPLSRSVDAAIVPLPIVPPSSLGYVVLDVSDQWVALRRRHRLAGPGGVPLARLVAEPLIMPAAQELWHANLELIFRAQGLTLRAGPPTSSMYEVMALVAAGDGWSMSAARADFTLWENIALRPAEGIERVRIAAVWDRREADERAELLVDALVAAASRAPDELPGGRARVARCYAAAASTPASASFSRR
jgi:DNA-binding transcriptional LysR family regulator